jgi:hypothetical protein
MDVSVAKPFIYVRVSGLWQGVSLNVYGVVPPASGEPKPTLEPLVSLAAGSAQTLAIKLKVVDGAFKHVAVSFAATTAKNDIGTATIDISRDEDALLPNGERPVFKSVALTRSAVSSPLFIMRTFALVGK